VGLDHDHGQGDAAHPVSPGKALLYQLGASALLLRRCRWRW